MKKITNIIFSRLVFVALCLVVQAATIVYILVLFREHFIWFYGLCLLVALAMLLYIVNSELNPAYKIAWLMPMMILPVFGALLYLMFGVNLRSKDQQQRMTEMHRQYRQAMAELPSPLLALRQQNPDGALQATYLQHLGTPLFQHTSSQFLHIGEVMYAKMLEDLRKAEKFIFMEYFIIEEGKMWNEILDILTQKAKAGVDVRLIYDDIGCMFTLDKNYYRKLEALGIKTWVFGRFIPVLATRFNNRNHRKICVIDGQIGYTGGINLADEYINVYEKHGHWLDCGIRLEGAAVWSFTVMFLSMWDYLHRIKEDFQFFAPNSQLTAEIANDGYVQPFTDMPFDDERVGETVYLNIVGRARKYLYISTPYLVVDHEMSTALQLAAKSGVDVRIITPHIPDKKLVFAITRSYYQELVEAGVRIYEYLPGFIHSKTFVCDDACAVVGTINLDFRSLYLHYECAACLWNAEAVMDVKKDFLGIIEKCGEVTIEQCHKAHWYQRLLYSVLRTFAPLV